MEKKIVKKTTLEEKDLVKVVGGKNAISSGFIGFNIIRNMNIFKRFH